MSTDLVPSEAKPKPNPAQPSNTTNPFETSLRMQFGHINVDQLKRAMQILPSNYDYEIIKTVLKILKAKQEFQAAAAAGAEGTSTAQTSYKVSL